MMLSKVRLCPTCRSRRIQKNRYQGRLIKEYYCKGCERTFRGLTILALLRIAFTGRDVIDGVELNPFPHSSPGPSLLRSGDKSG